MLFAPTKSHRLLRPCLSDSLCFSFSQPRPSSARFLTRRPLQFPRRPLIHPDQSPKRQLCSMTSSQDNGAKPSRPGITLKVPKGTRDWSGEDLLLRDEVFKTITDVFKRHAATPLDTPVFELKEILTGKYGEDSRLVYDLQDQGGELCSLRFDLTVPFARYLAMNNIQNIKRYQLAKVYRRDQPAIARGRLREFHQCDFDIAGVYDPMIPDAETLSVITEVFDALKIGINIRVNHRKILDGLFVVAGVPADKIRTISSAVDKLDKMSWEDVKKEMVTEKGLTSQAADRVGELVRKQGSVSELVASLTANAELRENESIKAGLADMTELGVYLRALGIEDRIIFDLSLARGLDYYTGLIYEVVNTKTAVGESESKSKKNDPANEVGSIAAGGRYDTLVGMFGKRQIPCVGVSFGVDRIFTILKSLRERENAAKPSGTEVYIMAFGGQEFDGLLPQRMDVARRLWAAGVRAEFSAKVKPKVPQQFKAAENVPVGVILGQDELKNGQVRFKRLGQGESKSEGKDLGTLVELDDLAEAVRRELRL